MQAQSHAHHMMDDHDIVYTTTKSADRTSTLPLLPNASTAFTPTTPTGELKDAPEVICCQPHSQSHSLWSLITALPRPSELKGTQKVTGFQSHPSPPCPTILSQSVLHHTTPRHATQRNATTHHTTPHHTTSHHTTSHHATQRNDTQRHATPQNIIARHDTPRNARPGHDALTAGPPAKAL